MADKGPNRKTPQLGRPQLTFQELGRLIRARAREFTILALFKYGYRNREDISNLPANTLVVGSQNVLTNAAEQVGVRQGYTLDGPAGSQNTYGIDSSYDYETKVGTIINLRKWGGNLQVRYVNPVSAAVTWITLLSTLNATKKMRFAQFWDASGELKRFVLMVNGDKNVFEWTGAVGSVASVSNAAGIISVLQPSSPVGSGGAGYAVGDILTLTGGNGDATFTVTAIAPGGIATVAVNAAGSGYVVNDVLTLQSAGGTLQATVKVTSINGGGGITGLTILTAGNGYTPGQSYTMTGGSGTLATVTVSTIGNTVVAGYLSANGTGYAAATVATTGGTGSGCTIVIQSVGTGSITLSGTKTTSQLGFYDTSNNLQKFRVLINGTQYQYAASNANGGMSLVGITPAATGAGIAVGDAVVQVVAIGATTGSGFLGVGYTIDIISNLKNQVWYGSNASSNVAVSKVNDYTSVTSSAVRLAGEGATLYLDGNCVGMFPISGQMYVTAGRSQWWVSQFLNQNISNGGVVTATELLILSRIKTSFNQAAQDHELIGSHKNAIIFVSNEQIINSFGLVKNINSEPQMVNLSDPIKFDIDAYDFTGGQVVYDNYFIYVLIPRQGVVRMFNVIRKYWEAPQTIPVARLYHTLAISGPSVVYGHSSLTDESYQLFTGYNDNGNPINAVAAFPYAAQAGGSINEKKSFNKFYSEGYMAANTTLMVTINYDFGGFNGSYTTLISGSNRATTFNKVTDGSLGQNSLGSQPIGTILNLPASASTPKFRIINTMPRLSAFEYQIVYSSNDVDFQWTLLRFGPAISAAPDIPVEITV